MNHILEYEAMSPDGEGARVMPPMPDFLKQAGAKTEYVFSGGPPPKDRTPNAWTISAKPMAKGIGECHLIFFPGGTFRLHTEGLGISSNRGTWKAQSGSSFAIGQTQIKGVSMQFNTLFGLATFD